MKKSLILIAVVLILAHICMATSPVSGGHPNPPVAHTLPATDISQTYARLNGSITDMGGLVSCAQVTFEYGEISGAYTMTTPPQFTNVDCSFSSFINNLRPCTTYFARAKGERCPGVGVLMDYYTGIYGAGIGLNSTTFKSMKFYVTGCVTYGAEISFTTTGCAINPGSSSTSSSSSSTTTQGPVSLPNLIVLSASLSASHISPSAPVTVTANVANKSTVNGSTRITVYVDGKEDSSQGITVNSGSTVPVTFTLSRNQPGTYTVHVGSVRAGSFTVDELADPIFILYMSAALLFCALVLGIIYIWRRQQIQG